LCTSPIDEDGINSRDPCGVGSFRAWACGRLRGELARILDADRRRAVRSAAADSHGWCDPASGQTLDGDLSGPGRGRIALANRGDRPRRGRRRCRGPRRALVRRRRSGGVLATANADGAQLILQSASGHQLDRATTGHSDRGDDPRHDVRHRSCRGATASPARQPASPSGDVRVAALEGCNNCGTGCTANGSVRALRARVSIPAVEGGFAPEGYAAWLWITNDQPHELPDGRGGTLVNLGGIQRVERFGATDVLVSVPSEDQPYAPCFTLRVFDPAGHFVDAPPSCLARQDINATIRDLDATITPPAASDSNGCALISSESDLGVATLLAWLASCATALMLGCGRHRSGTRRREVP